MANKAVFGIVSTEEQASAIVDDLRSAGCASDDVSALFPDKGRSRDFAHEQQTKAPEGATMGATAGGLLGGTLGWLAGIGALAIPGLGPFIAAGPIMAALAGGFYAQTYALSPFASGSPARAAYATATWSSSTSPPSSTASTPTPAARCRSGA